MGLLFELIYMLNFHIEKNEDGFLATCPSIEGAFAEGATELEALANLFDVIQMIQEYKNNKPKVGQSSIDFSIPISV